MEHGRVFQAGSLIESDPEEVAADLVEKLGDSGRELVIGLKDNRFTPHLGQELLVQMEAESRWIISRDARTNAPPNYLRHLDTSILRKSNRSSVTVIE
jgi:hypothetical protein